MVKEKDLFFPDSDVLTPWWGSKVQNLRRTLEGIDQHHDPAHSFKMSETRLREEEERVRKLAQALGFWENGGIDRQALDREWKIIQSHFNL